MYTKYKPLELDTVILPPVYFGQISQIEVRIPYQRSFKKLSIVVTGNDFLLHFSMSQLNWNLLKV